MKANELKKGDTIELKNDTGTYKLTVDEVAGGLARCLRWNNKKGVWSKTSMFAISPETKNWRLI